MKKTIALGLLLLLTGVKAWAYTEIEGFTGETWYDHRASDFGGGRGYSYDPYIISTPEQLALLAWKVNEEGNTYDEKYFRLDADISLKGYVWVPIGIHNSNNDRVFKGILSGGEEEGYRTISDMTIKATGTGKTDYFGLFGHLLGTVERLKLEKVIVNINCTADIYLGLYCAMTGTNDTNSRLGTIYRCDVESADITVNAGNRSLVGGIVGGTELYVNKLRNCVAKTKMRLAGIGAAGGVAGAASRMRDCHAVVDIVSTSDGIDLGGLIGTAWLESSSNEIICCSAAGEIEETGNDTNVGGLVGRIVYDQAASSGKLQYCTTCVTVKGKNNLGGLFGYCLNRTSPCLKYCFSSSFVDGREAKHVGGLVGYLIGQGTGNHKLEFGTSVTFAGTMTKPTSSKYYGVVVGLMEKEFDDMSDFGYYSDTNINSFIFYDYLMCNFKTNGNNRSLGGIYSFETPSLDQWDYSHYWKAIVPLQAPSEDSEPPYYRDIYDLCSIPFHVSPDRKNYFPAYDATVDFSLENLMNNYNHEKMANYQVEASNLVKVGDDLKVQPLDPGELMVYITHKGLVRKVYLNITYGVEWDGTSTSTSFFGIGDGTEAKPYMIHNVAELKGVMESSQLNKAGVYFKLANDLFMNNHLLQDDETPREGAHKWTPGEWKANLDGNGKMIYGLYVDEDEPEDYMCYGLFTTLYGTIKDLGIVDSYVRVIAERSSRGIYAGMFCGNAVENARIERCLAHGVVVTDGSASAAGFAGTAGEYIDAQASNVQFIDCLSAVHIRPNLRYAGAGITFQSEDDSSPIKLQRCLNIGKVDTGYGLVKNDTQDNLSEDSYFDLQMMKGLSVDTKGAKMTGELISGEIFKNESAWVQQEGRYPLLAQFAKTSYGDLLSMPISFYYDDEKTDRSGNVTEIFEFVTDDVEWHANGGDEYMDVIQKCGAASLNKATASGSPEYLVGQSTLAASRCTQAKRSVALDIDVDGVVGIRFKDPNAEQACIQAFDHDGNNIITLRESCEATNEEFKELFNPAATEVQYFPEMRFFVGVENLEKGILSGLSQLSELELPKQLLTIDEESFGGCSLLENITLPTPFEETLPRAFYGSSIRDIFVAKKNKTLESRQGVLYTNDNGYLYYPYALMAYPPGRGQDTAVVCGPLRTILSCAIYKIPGLKAVYVDNPLPEGEFVELLDDGIVHENAPELMQVYINDGSSWGAELEYEDAPVLFEEYESSYDWNDYFEQGKILRYYPLNVTSAGWATLYVGFAVDLPSALSPYIVIDKNFDEKVATLKRISQLVPHETPMVIKAEQPGQYLLYSYTEPVPEISKFENRLIGSYIGQNEEFGTPMNQIDLSNGSVLTLGRNKNGTVGFYYYNSVASIPPYRAYLTYNPVTPEPGAKSYFTFFIDDTIDTEPDGIDTAVSGQPRPTAVFNLQGMKVADELKNLPKGIYIVGGRKIIVP